MPNIEAITMDLDDTLWDCHPVITKAEEKLWDWLNTNYPEIIECFDSDSVLKLRKKITSEYPNKTHDYRFIRRSVLKIMFSVSGYDSKYAEDAFDFFDKHRNKVTPYEGAIETLEILSKKYRLIALTNGNANLETIGIKHFFYDSVYAADFGYPKPDIRIFNEAIRRSGKDKEKIFHVGDNPETDIVGASNAGIRTVWMNSTKKEWPSDLKNPDIIISKIDELCKIFD
ncbi:MAG: HAD family hydrolase [Gammaproteobacteria bacterium]|nr:MAG: HAD family hydrolase [Gammaproteobacteria bacterium]